MQCWNLRFRATCLLWYVLRLALHAPEIASVFGRKENTANLRQVTTVVPSLFKSDSYTKCCCLCPPLRWQAFITQTSNSRSDQRPKGSSLMLRDVTNRHLSPGLFRGLKPPPCDLQTDQPCNSPSSFAYEPRIHSYSLACGSKNRALMSGDLACLFSGRKISTCTWYIFCSLLFCPALSKLASSQWFVGAPSTLKCHMCVSEVLFLPSRDSVEGDCGTLDVMVFLSIWVFLHTLTDVATSNP